MSDALCSVFFVSLPVSFRLLPPFAFALAVPQLFFQVLVQLPTLPVLCFSFTVQFSFTSPVHARSTPRGGESSSFHTTIPPLVQLRLYSRPLFLLAVVLCFLLTRSLSLRSVLFFSRFLSLSSLLFFSQFLFLWPSFSFLYFFPSPFSSSFLGFLPSPVALGSLFSLLSTLFPLAGSSFLFFPPAVALGSLFSLLSTLLPLLLFFIRLGFVFFLPSLSLLLWVLTSLRGSAGYG